MNKRIEDIRRRTKAGELNREERIAEVDRAIEEYFAETGNMPDDKALERLADLLLYEELTDTDRMKVRNNEYPIISDTQIARRQEGKHARKRDNPNVEVPFSVAGNIGTDGKNHAIPTRRQRSSRENAFLDKEAKTRNDERLRKYSEFTKIQPVELRKIGT